MKDARWRVFVFWNLKDEVLMPWSGRCLRSSQMSNFCSLKNEPRHTRHIYIWSKWSDVVLKRRSEKSRSAPLILRSVSAEWGRRIPTDARDLGLCALVLRPWPPNKGAEMRPEKLSFWSLSAALFCGPLTPNQGRRKTAAYSAVMDRQIGAQKAPWLFNLKPSKMQLCVSVKSAC